MTKRGLTAWLAVLVVAACQRSAAIPQSQTSPAASSTPSAIPSIGTAETPSGLPVGSTPESTGPATSSSRCHTSQLALRFAGAQGAAGTMFLTFRLSNTAADPCLLRGFVGMQMLDASGAPMPTRVVRNGGMFVNQPPPSGFSLRPAAGSAPAATAASFQVAYSNVPRSGETGCPDAFELVVTPPDEFDHLSIAVEGWTLAPCNHGELDVTPLRPPGVAPP